MNEASSRQGKNKLRVQDWGFYVKLQPYRKKSVANKKCLKLATKYFSPYKILDRIGAMAY